MSEIESADICSSKNKKTVRKIDTQVKIPRKVQ